MAGLYATTVPVLIGYLRRLDGMLMRLPDFAMQSGRGEEEILAASLAEDMFDFRRQVLIAANFAMRTLAPVVPSLAGLTRAEGHSIADLRERITERVAALEALDPAPIDAAEGQPARDTAGKAVVEMDALTFATQYALPNFFFHLVNAYAILRLIGVPIGKADFDGLHRYPPGFRFD